MTAALLIAGGNTPKGAPVHVGGIPAVQRQVLAFQLAGVQRVVLVAGEELAQLQKRLAHMGVVFLQSLQGQPTREMEAVRLGLCHLQGKARAVLVAPVDAPLIAQSTVEKLLAAKEGEAPAVPAYGGKAGWPVLLPGHLIPQLLAYSGNGGLADALQAAGIAPAQIPARDEGALQQKDKMPQGAAKAMPHALAPVRPVAKVYLAAEKPFYGPGPHLLMALIDETQMLRQACQLMGISYSKGWKMLDEMEQQYGARLVEKTRGGAEKGQSRLTVEGRRLLEKYEVFQHEAARRVEEAYREIFGEED